MIINCEWICTRTNKDGDERLVRNEKNGGRVVGRAYHRETRLEHNARGHGRRRQLRCRRRGCQRRNDWKKSDRQRRRRRWCWWRLSLSQSQWVRWWIFCAHIRLELNKFLCYFVIVPLWENTQYRPASLIHMNAFAKSEPTCARTLLHHLLQLHNSNADKAVVSGEAIILHADVQFKEIKLFFVSDDTKNQENKIIALNTIN